MRLVPPGGRNCFPSRQKLPIVNVSHVHRCRPRPTAARAAPRRRCARGQRAGGVARGGRVSRPLGDAAAELRNWPAAWPRTFSPISKALSLANGYRFFAPEPGPSHLVRYELTLRRRQHRAGRLSRSRSAQAAIALSPLFHAQRVSSTRSKTRRARATASRPLPRAMPSTWRTSITPRPSSSICGATTCRAWKKCAPACG